MESLKGVVKWFSKERGYGFISSDDREYFVHFSDVNMEGYRYLEKGQKVAFYVEETEKGQQAIDVLVIAEAVENE